MTLLSSDSNVLRGVAAAISKEEGLPVEDAKEVQPLEASHSDDVLDIITAVPGLKSGHGDCNVEATPPCGGDKRRDDGGSDSEEEVTKAVMSKYEEFRKACGELLDPSTTRYLLWETWVAISLCFFFKIYVWAFVWS